MILRTTACGLMLGAAMLVFSGCADEERHTSVTTESTEVHHPVSQQSTTVERVRSY